MCFLKYILIVCYYLRKKINLCGSVRKDPFRLSQLEVRVGVCWTESSWQSAGVTPWERRYIKKKLAL